MKPKYIHSTFLAIALIATFSYANKDTKDKSPISIEKTNIKPFLLDSSLSDYKLVWQDEFANTDKSPNLDEWYYETGNHGWGNKEIQNYISGFRGNDTCAIVNDGKLKITLRKVGDEILSIRINTKKSWQYGYFEGRLKLPKGKGTWPAFWMLPEGMKTWPDEGEIDIMEHVAYAPNVIHSTIHCAAYNHKIGTQKAKQMKVTTSMEEFHIYAVEWTADYIKGFVDGICYFTFENDKKGDNTTWPFDKPFYLKLNLAWGGWGGAQGFDESALPATYEIDYVRVFQK